MICWVRSRMSGYLILLVNGNVVDEVKHHKYKLKLPQYNTYIYSTCWLSEAERYSINVLGYNSFVHKDVSGSTTTKG